MKIYTYEALVVGSGAAGLCAAARLGEMGVDVALLTEGMMCGTSRNTGSDKQTYYKLSCAGGDSDSAMQMAKNLFSFGAVDGDNALCEAALSLRCFFSLAEGGVPFPHNRFGEYIGYKTDHDPYRRATSAGPLTSKFMTELWEKRVKELNLPVLDGYLAVEILKRDNRACGLLALHIASGELIAVSAPYVILATGGPAGIYEDSVYPESQHGALGLAAAAGLKLQNLTEWQYGLASVCPRWNVSGTYMQVLPRFVSVDEEGREYEFLLDYFSNPHEALSSVFLKGYQWPFDCKKAESGSSLIDLMVFYETSVKKRRVYLDFTKNPFGMQEIDFSRLEPAAYEYLSRAEATLGTPIDRLLKMNTPAVELYAGKGVDITKEYLEIALCAQHHNGGIAVDCFWMTSAEGLFAVGECAGTHGIARPGGSALNAGQVGALRAAQYIGAHRIKPEHSAFENIAENAAQAHIKMQKAWLKNRDTVDARLAAARRSMSDVGGAVRSKEEIGRYLEKIKELLQGITENAGVSSPACLYKAYRYRDILLSQQAVLFAMYDFISAGCSSRGSAIFHDDNGIQPRGLDARFRFRMEKSDSARNTVQEVCMTDGGLTAHFREVRPLPSEDDFFENVWKQYRGGAVWERE